MNDAKDKQPAAGWVECKRCLGTGKALPAEGIGYCQDCGGMGRLRSMKKTRATNAERVRSSALVADRERKTTAGRRKSGGGEREVIRGLQREITRLREYIRDEGVITDTCTYDVLKEICVGCRCQRMGGDKHALSAEQPGSATDQDQAPQGSGASAAPKTL